MSAKLAQANGICTSAVFGMACLAGSEVNVQHLCLMCIFLTFQIIFLASWNVMFFGYFILDISFSILQTSQSLEFVGWFFFAFSAECFFLTVCVFCVIFATSSTYWWSKCICFDSVWTSDNWNIEGFFLYMFQLLFLYIQP